MSRYIRSQLKRLRERIGTPESPEAREARERMVKHLDCIADARRSGNWTDEDAASLSETVRAASEARRRRRGEGGV